MAIKQLRCYLDNLSGFVFGIEYAYGNSQYRQLCVGPNNLGPSGKSNSYIQRQDMNMKDAQGIVKVDVMALAGTPVSAQETITPLDARRGKIPAIVFTKYDKPNDEYIISVCGNTELYETGQLTIASTYVNPTGEEFYLGSMQADCAKRNLFGANGGAVGDPNAPMFFVKTLKELCWAPYYHPLPNVPGNPPPPHQTVRPYEVHNEPCIPPKGNTDKGAKNLGDCATVFPEIVTAGSVTPVPPPAPKKAPAAPPKKASRG